MGETESIVYVLTGERENLDTIYTVCGSSKQSQSASVPLYATKAPKFDPTTAKYALESLQRAVCGIYPIFGIVVVYSYCIYRSSAFAPSLSDIRSSKQHSD
jgi:hypothetical protein